MTRSIAAVLLALTLIAGCATAPPAVQPPLAAQRPTVLTQHGHERVDEYYWLRERENREVIAYLEAENAYLKQTMKHTEGLQEQLYEEIVARIPPRDESVPTLRDGYFYYTRFEEGKDYPIYVRRKEAMTAPEEVMLDVNALAAGQSYFNVAGVSVSRGNDIVAYATDNVGRRKYTLRFKNLTTGQLLPDEIPLVSGNQAWANDNRTIFYSRKHPETLRSYRIYRHELGTDPAGDTLVFEEADETFSTFVFRTKSKRYIVIGSGQTLTSEYRYLDADQPRGEPQVFEPRKRGREYSIDHYGDHFYIRTNDDARNFRLMKTPVSATGRENWSVVIPHRPDVYLGGFEIFRDHLVVSERKDGLIRLRVMPWSGGDHYIPFDEPAYVARIADNPEFDTSQLRFTYSSLTTPFSTYQYDMTSRDRTLLKRTAVGGGYDPANYQTERIYASARDGKRVPVSILYRNGFKKDGSAPLLLYAYGSYGSSIDPGFNSSVISLADRGFVYAIAHIRGGQELGREWYEQGKLLQKKNTFTDYIDVAEHLVAQKYADRERVFGYGGSAGGLLMGAVVNMRPDLFKGVVAAVPFVDVITTMLDASIPLTTFEYDEWGNPADRQYYDYMLSYSPYDNVQAREYPHLLVTTGLHDSQVQYWEPAKWVARLRARKIGDQRILMHTNMEAGHGGQSGRFRRQKETALMYAFLIDLAGK
ncbi:MAG TPA: S9 family peptidase [Thermoanaerobaculia bacterium]|nr:S9 family peptidase [Thermoanaerobaculia bacterium]